MSCRKVTYIQRSQCSSGGQRIVTVTQQSSGSGWVQVPQQIPQTVIYKTVQSSPTPVVTGLNNGGSNSGVGASSSSFEAAVLAAHNRLRAKHSAAPLTLNATISQCAQEWADNIARRNCMQHRPNNSYGENIYACFGKTNISGEEAVQSWYNEIKDYSFGQANPSNFSKVGHFTQVVWKNSKQLGVGIAKNGNNVYVVCNYDPPGNYGGQYPANVTRS